MTALEMIAAAETLVTNAANHLNFGVVLSQADKLATEDAAAILAAAAFEVATPKTPAQAAAQFDYAFDIDAAETYEEIVAVSKAYSAELPNPHAVRFNG